VDCFEHLHHLVDFEVLPFDRVYHFFDAEADQPRNTALDHGRQTLDKCELLLVGMIGLLLLSLL